MDFIPSTDVFLMIQIQILTTASVTSLNIFLSPFITSIYGEMLMTWLVHDNEKGITNKI